jgi:alkylation response protein AidB-like acyl-CoA dehydrogenase
VLKHSRIIVIWNAIGGCIGVYKNALRYTLERQQFGRPIAGFQLVQEKLVRIMANLQAILLAGWRLTELYEQDQSLSTGKIGMFKAWVTERGRLICALGR